MSVSTASIMSSTTFMAFALGLFPAVCMLLFTLLGLGVRVPPAITGALQHFAAGVLLCTIGTELLPEMVNAKGWDGNLASGIGFFAGVFLLILLGMVVPEIGIEDNDDSEAGDSTTGGTGTGTATDVEKNNENASNKERPPIMISVRRKKESYMTSSLKSSSFVEDASSRAGSYAGSRGARSQGAASSKASYKFKTTLNGYGENQPLLGLVPSSLRSEEIEKDSVSAGSKGPSRPFPTALVTAVAIDSALDGLLIGIAVAAGPSAGPMMSASLSVEMGFLGLALATALHGHPTSKSMPAAWLGPVVIVLGATVGGLLSELFKHSPVLLAGLMGFGTSALLFMVAEELLLEAHEDGEHVWWVDLQLYTGFFVSCMAGKYLPDAEA